MVTIGLSRPMSTDSNNTDFCDGFDVGSAVIVVSAMVVVFKVVVFSWLFLNTFSRQVPPQNCDGSPEHGLLH